MSARRLYIRPMAADWWRKNPFLLRYMLREMTSVLVAAYALVLLIGLVALARGEATYLQWLETLRSPWSLVFHGVLLAVFIYHSYSWFEIMPKTLPAIWIGGRRLPDALITVAGLAATVVCSAVLLGGVLWLSR
ncbi:MAG: fumarate reductase subunit C [Burkholderiales bacterium]